MTVRILVGDARGRLAELPDGSVHCVVTSPPYWGLRAYQGDPGMIGLEPTFDEHLANLVAVFREVRRVLRDDGTLWLNYGDAYATGTTAKRNPSPADVDVGGWQSRMGESRVDDASLKPKDLMMMPARVAMALQADGWWLRSEIIWHKPNPMPESVTDRPTSAHEKVFLLTKSARYFYDAEAVRVPASASVVRRDGLSAGGGKSHAPERDDAHRRAALPFDAAAGANLRNVWSIATHSFSAAHFATFPPALVEPCIKAGTSERGVCGECGAPWGRVGVASLELPNGRPSNPAAIPHGERNDQGSNRARDGHVAGGRKTFETTDWRPTCDHHAAVIPATCLDPFGGAGTVGLVADRLQRDAILVEISPEYAEMARRRIHDDAPLFATVG